MDVICVSPQIGQVRRDFANKNAKFSGERLKFVHIAFLYKLDVIYSKSIPNKVSVPSAENENSQTLSNKLAIFMPVNLEMHTHCLKYVPIKHGLFSK